MVECVNSKSGGSLAGELKETLEHFSSEPKHSKVTLADEGGFAAAVSGLADLERKKLNNMKLADGRRLKDLSRSELEALASSFKDAEKALEAAKAAKLLIETSVAEPVIKIVPRRDAVRFL